MGFSSFPSPFFLLPSAPSFLSLLLLFRSFCLFLFFLCSFFPFCSLQLLSRPPLHQTHHHSHHPLFLTPAYETHRQDMIYKPRTILTRSTILSEMPFPRVPSLLKMKLEDIVTGLEQMIAGAPGMMSSSDNYHVTRYYIT